MSVTNLSQVTTLQAWHPVFVATLGTHYGYRDFIVIFVQIRDFPRGNVIRSEKYSSFITNSRRNHALGLTPSCMTSTTIRDKSLESVSSLELHSFGKNSRNNSNIPIESRNVIRVLKTESSNHFRL